MGLNFVLSTLDRHRETHTTGRTEVCTVTTKNVLVRSMYDVPWWVQPPAFEWARHSGRPRALAPPNAGPGTVAPLAGLHR